MCADVSKTRSRARSAALGGANQGQLPYRRLDIYPTVSAVAELALDAHAMGAYRRVLARQPSASQRVFSRRSLV
jgi:hypothetical protein